MTQPVTEAEVGPVSDDNMLAFLKRSGLVDDRGVPFRDYRRELTPRYGVVWTQLALGYLALIAVGAAIVFTAPYASGWLRVIVGALLFGFFQAYIQLFLHEAAHYNLAPGRARNDRVANWCVGAIHGLEIGAYRIVHFEHHRRIGTTMDSERTYFDPLNMRFFATSLLGIKGLQVLSRRKKNVDASAAAVPSAGATRQRIVAAVIHLAIVGVAVLTRQYALAIAWTLGTLSVMPLFVALRQLLEHRSEDAHPETDYSTVNHGSVHRLFGDGPLASTLGGAGFNRHLLHHWEPQISYTRLRELEDYLLRTEAAPGVRARRSTYLQTFWALISW